MTERRRELLAELALVGIAAIWGATFTVVQDAIEKLPTMAFLGYRFLAAAALVAVIFRHALKRLSREGLRAGVLMGVFLTAGYIRQTLGLERTTPSDAGFITGLFVVFTPIAAAVLFRRPPRVFTMIGVAVATIGLFLLTGAHLRLHAGDALTLGCAVSFGVHIAVLGELAPEYSPLPLNALQLAVVSVGCAVVIPFVGVGHVTARAIAGSLFTGVAVSAGAFTLQVFGQQYVGPTRTGLMLVLEPVFAGLLGYVIGDRLGGLGLTGAALILLGVLIAEVRPLR